MNTAYLVALRELRERSRLFLVAAATALIPFLAAIVPGVGHARGTAIATSAGVLSLMFATAIALGLGISTTGRELTEKRLSFYFSRPIAPAALWIGKAVAALLTVYAVAAIIALPAYLAASGAWKATWGGTNLPIFAVVAPLTLFLGSHALSTMVRSRSLLLALDFVLAVITAVAVYLMVRSMLLGGATDAAKWLLVAFGVALLLILALVPIGQLAYGRIDVRRSHAALARFLWPSVGVVLALSGAFVLWLTSGSIEGLDTLSDLQQSGNGEWVFVHGADNARMKYESSFFVNTVTGEQERFGRPLWWGSSFSRDGRVLSWLEPVGILPQGGVPSWLQPIQNMPVYDHLELHVRRLDGGNTDPVATGIEVTMGSPHVLSEDGSRVAIAYGEQVSVIEVASGKILAAAKTGVHPLALFFVRPDLVRIVEYGSLTRAARIAELDVVNRKSAITGKMPMPAQTSGTSANADGSLLYVPTVGMIVDGRTGAKLGVLPDDVKGSGSRMLNDGTVVATRANTIRRFDATGRELQRIPSPLRQANVLGEIGDSKVILGSREGSLILDLKRGAVDQHLRGGYPAWSWSPDPRVRRYTPGATINYMQWHNRGMQILQTKTAG